MCTWRPTRTRGPCIKSITHRSLAWGFLKVLAGFGRRLGLGPQTGLPDVSPQGGFGDAARGDVPVGHQLFAESVNRHPRAAAEQLADVSAQWLGDDPASARIAAPLGHKSIEALLAVAAQPAFESGHRVAAPAQARNSQLFLGHAAKVLGLGAGRRVQDRRDDAVAEQRHGLTFFFSIHRLSPGPALCATAPSWGLYQGVWRIDFSDRMPASRVKQVRHKAGSSAHYRHKSAYLGVGRFPSLAPGDSIDRQRTPGPES